jgi:hypothetical protein
MILFQENFISIIDCDNIIDIFKKNKHNTSFYPLNYTNILKVNLIESLLLNSIKNKVTTHCESLTNSKIFLDNCEIVEWPTNSYHPSHYDSINDIFSCVIYLNDNFDGGETYFSDSKIIKPKKGSCLTFSNSKYKHSVNKINNGIRYTLSSWFTRTNNYLER